MNCTLTPQQQRLLFGKVAIDLNKAKDFQFDDYARKFHDLIRTKTGDPVLAMTYVGLLPANIRAVMGINRDVFSKLASSAAVVSGKEAAFENFDKVQEYVNGFNTQTQEANVVKENIIKDSQINPPAQQEIPVDKVPEFKANPALILSDLVMDTDINTGQIRPGMKIYADAKTQIIKNVQPDGSSIINGVPVRLTMSLTKDFKVEDFYPDTQAEIQADPTKLENANKGIVLLVTDPEGKPIRFTADLVKSDEGSLIHYNFRNPVEGRPLLETDLRQLKQLESQGMTYEQALAVTTRKLKLLADARKYIHQTGKSLQVDIKGGQIRYVPPIKKGASPVSALKIVAPINFYRGIPARNQRPNVYYFDLPGTEMSVSVNRKEFTPEMVNKLVSLITTDLTFTRGGQTFAVTPENKLKLLRQFLYTDPKALDIRVVGGELVVYRMGQPQSYASKEEMGQALRTMFTRRIPAEELTPAKAQAMYGGRSNKVTNLETAQFDDVYEFPQPDGSVKYYRIDTIKLSINKTLFNSNSYEDFEINGNTLTTTTRKYFGFIQDNFTVPYAVDSQGGLQSAGSNLEFTISPAANVDIIDKPKVEVSQPTLFDENGFIRPEYDKPKMSAKDYLASLKGQNPDKWNKIAGQGSIKAMEAQIEEAEKWYSQSPLSKHFPFQAMFEKVNAEDSNVIANWAINCVKLYKGADASDLYHEAWHGFTQGLLPREDREGLYREVRTKSGTFIDFQGNTVKFSDATNKQLEEYLAEDFRAYMLSGGKLVMDKAPKRNTLFRRILNFLKELFGSATVRESVIDERVNQKVAELYQRLRVGDLATYSFSAENAEFNTLNKAMQPVKGGIELSFETSDLISDSVDALFSEALDEMNAANLQAGNRKRDLEQKPNLTPEEKEELENLQAQYTSSYTAVILSKLKGVASLYRYAQLKFEERLSDVQEQFKVNPSADLQKTLQTLQYAVDNFGDATHPELSLKDKGVIGYHLQRSQLISSRIKDAVSQFQSEVSDDVEHEAREMAGKNFFENKSNDTIIYDLVSEEIKAIVSSLYQPDVNRQVQPNALGFPTLVDFRQSWAYIMQTVQNSTGLEDMYQRLKSERINYPPIDQLLRKLGPLSYEGQTDKESGLWLKFYHSANKYRILLRQTEIAEQRDDNTGESNYDIRIGNAISEIKKIDRTWKNEFFKSGGPFMRNDIHGNYLDAKSLLDKYQTIQEVNANPFEFLQDIGMSLSNLPVIKSQLEKEVKSGNIRLSGIYDNIRNLQERNFIIRGIGQFTRHNSEMGVTGQVGPKGNYGKILQLESQYSGRYSDFMVANAEGEQQSEYNQQSSITQIVSLFNRTGNFNNLLSQPQTAHFSPTPDQPGRPYNYYTDRSIWINALYDRNRPDGPRYPGNTMQVDNLSGTIPSINGRFTQGLSQAGSDELTRLISDIHQQVMGFTPELTRHAGKSASFSVTLSNYKTGAKNPRLYIDTESFIPESNGYVSGVFKYVEILRNYLSGELDRINYVKKLLDSGELKQTDFKYLERATQFHSFAGVLSDQTKQALLEGKINPKLEDIITREIVEYFSGLVQQVNNRSAELGGSFISPTLINQLQGLATLDGKTITPEQARAAVISSFVANNWIHHFEEMIVIYGDVAQYSDFFKRNASMASPGDVMPSDQTFVNYINNKVGKPLATSQGLKPEPFNSIFRTAVVDDVKSVSAYLDQYTKATSADSTAKAYSKVNETDASCLVAFDTYRILAKGLGEWSDEQEGLFQSFVRGDKPAYKGQFPPVFKMGYAGPLLGQPVPMTALHKFAMMPIIPGLSENMDALHHKMMSEGIDYLTYVSGSKISTISEWPGPQQLYSDVQTRTLSDKPFVPNLIHTDFLKYQVKASPKYKGKVTLISQLRKLVSVGMFDQGIPVDYKGSDWNSLTEEQKLKASDNYKNYRAYIGAMDKFVAYKKQELLYELGVKDGGSTKDIKLDKLLALISDELQRSDVGEHEWNYIQTIRRDTIKNPLDVSPSAEIIEKTIVALANKRLVTPKVKGEQFVLVPSTLFENKAFAYSEPRKFDKPTAEQVARYGTNDLPTYHIRNGKITAAKIKIAIQGDFKQLMQLPSVIEKSKSQKMSRLDALNILLKDEAWLDENNHRQMVTMVGARVPTQGPNSTDFVEVYEFLPEYVGNILLAPPEITAKTGGDFDYDKLPMLMPHIRMVDGEPTYASAISKKKAKQLHDEIIKTAIQKDELINSQGKLQWKKDAAADKLLGDIFGANWDLDYTDDEIRDILRDQGKKPFDEYYSELNGSPVLENNIIQTMRAMMERPDNFENLVRPNDVDIAKPIAEGIRGDQKHNNQGTRMYEPLRSIEVQQANSVGKDALGIGAINNTFNAVSQAIGLELAPSFDAGRATILMPHNSTPGGISLSGLKDTDGNSISEVVSQLINGWVDVEKDDWISYIQGNKELAPVLLFLVRSGVPLKKAVTFLRHPIIQEYVKQQRLQKSPVGGIFGAAGNYRNYRRPAQRNILRRFGIIKPKPGDLAELALIYTEGITDITDLMGNQVASGETKAAEPLRSFGGARALQDDIKNDIDPEEFKRRVLGLFQNAGSPEEVKFLHRKFTLLTHPDKGGKLPLSQALNAALDEYRQDPEGVKDFDKPIKKAVVRNPDLAVFLHFLEIENIVAGLDKLQRAFNVDTNKAQTVFEFAAKTQEIEDAEQNTLISDKYVKSILNNSAIGPFYVHKFVTDVFGRLMTLLNNPELNKFLFNFMQDSEAKGLFGGDPVQTARVFKSDLIYYIFQQKLRGYDKAIASVEDAEGVEFSSDNERAYFVDKRDELKGMYPMDSIIDNFDYQDILSQNKATDNIRLSDETDVDFDIRMREKSYKEWLNEQALFDIFSPYQLLKAPRNVAAKYEALLFKYPQLKTQFSILGNIKQSTSSGLTNLMLSTTKLSSAEVDRFHQNLKQLANSNELLKISGIDQKDADYIATFFKKLPLYLYMQSGPNTRNPFSFARVIPVQRIQRLIGEDVQRLGKTIDAKYLAEFAGKFLVVNSDISDRNRFKDYMINDRIDREKLGTEDQQLELPELEYSDSADNEVDLWERHHTAILQKYPDLTKEQFDSLSEEETKQLIDCL